MLRAVGARKAQQAALAAGSTAAEVVVDLAPDDVLRATRRELTEALAVSGTLKEVDSAQVKARVAGDLIGLTLREALAIIFIYMILASQWARRARGARARPCAASRRSAA